MKTPIIAAILLVLAMPALASPRHSTPAQQKDIHRLYAASWRCLEYNPDNGSDPNYAIPEDENQMSKNACNLSIRWLDALRCVFIEAANFASVGTNPEFV
jgi:hypothetical protein